MVNGAARIAGYSGDLDYALSATLNTTDGTPGARNGTRDLANDSGAVSLKTTFAPSTNARLTGVLRYARTNAEFNDSDSDPGSPTFGFQVDSPGNRFENEAIYVLIRGELDLLAGPKRFRPRSRIPGATVSLRLDAAMAARARG